MMFHVLTIEARGRLVQEEEQFGFASEHHSKCHTPPCLASEARYRGVSERSGFKGSSGFFHIGILLCIGGLAWLAEMSRESRWFSNCCRALMNVHLFGCFKVQSVSYAETVVTKRGMHRV